jgi:quercetin 2,3-dioxygenase
MTQHRCIRKVFQSRPTIEGAGVHLRRAIGFGEQGLFDPFLLLDDFRSDRPDQYLKGFPWHPHRGIETVTYLLRGNVEHGDSLGNSGVIAAGDMQWMSAGSGIIHQEMPKGDSAGAMGGFQLWANLPAADKMMTPRYRGITADEIPAVTDANGARVKVICGEVNGIRGPVRDIVTDPEYLDVTIAPGGTFAHRTTAGHTVFAYCIEGQGIFGNPADPYSYETEPASYFVTAREALIGDGHVVLFGDGDAVTIQAQREPVRFLLIAGKPIGEPIAWYGPIVMNTQEELRVAFDELQQGTFIKNRGTSA